jgi:hypothetical protein
MLYFCLEFQCIEVRKFPEISAQVNVPESGRLNTERHIEESKSDSNAANIDKKNTSLTLPIFQKSDIHLNINHEIGRGTIGTVFKGKWAGTSVATQAD